MVLRFSVSSGGYTALRRQGGGIARRSAPILQMIREEVTDDGKYCLVLVFEAKALELSDFEKRREKFASFFGPGISSEIVKGDKDLYEVRLISNTTFKYEDNKFK